MVVLAKIIETRKELVSISTLYPRPLMLKYVAMKPFIHKVVVGGLFFLQLIDPSNHENPFCLNSNQENPTSKGQAKLTIIVLNRNL